ncbi:MAG: aminoglycoside phosphotransferase family protein [Clostridia bacterium]|nr:aminoglycoside phosphotransferase family protein [Clostridia bacterium]
MNILDNSDKHLLPLLPEIIFEKLCAEVKELKFIGGGSFGRVYRAVLSDGRKIALKAYRVQGSQEKEAEQLTILAENTAVKMPEVLFTYEDESTALLAMTFVEGENALNPAFLLKSKKQKEAFASAVIDGMLGWHSVKGERFGSLSQPSYESWYEYYRKEKQEPWLKALGELCEKGKFGRKRLDLLKEATELFNSLPEKECEPVLIHADLNIMNIMADSKSFALTAFIDPCGSMWADREYDLFQLRNMWGDAYGLYKTYKKKYPLDGYADFRVAYYASMHEAAMRLSGGIAITLWEDLNNMRLKKEMKKIRK